MNARKENWNYFIKKYPKAHRAYEEFGKALSEESGPLDARSCALIKVGIAAACQYDYALRRHIEKAIQSGCTADEIEQTILLTATTAGFPKMMAALIILREELEMYP